MTTIRQRIAALEKQSQAEAEHSGPAYVSVANLQELDALELKRPTKVYIGFLGPGEWDREVTIDQ